MTKKGLAARIRKALRRNPHKHSFIHVTELDEYWPDRTARQVALHQFAYKYNVAIAWYDVNIGAIFVKKSDGIRARTRPTARRHKRSAPSPKFPAAN